MARIRKVEIENYRDIKALTWCPSPGLNCLIGPGDSGKSTILDAIDRCLGARRALQFTDADFHGMEVEAPIVITITIGELEDSLKNLDTYGLYLRGYDAETGAVEDEPEKDHEAVLTLRLTVASDLEPTWTLHSDRGVAQDAVRNLAWSDRVAIAPTRIGTMANYDLGWRKGSLLNRLSDEEADTSAALAKAGRDARGAFGEEAEKQLGETLQIVMEATRELGIDVGDRVRALLDAHSVSFSSGTISLHDEEGVPLRGLGLGSTRLLIAGLQRKVAESSRILLVDELEHGLEPHRIMRFLGSLGAKETPPPLQVYLTTHSPVALRELAGDQLVVLRDNGNRHSAISVGTENAVQSTIRMYPDAFLAPSVIVCEGASEIGLLRGLDQYRVGQELVSIFACGVALVDCGGGEADRLFVRASAFLRLGYRVAVLRDDDQKPTEGVEKEFEDQGGTVFTWCDDCALEDDLFASVSDGTVEELVNFAVELHGEELIDNHVKSVTENDKDLEAVRGLMEIGILDEATRTILGKASRRRRNGWFKSVSWMEKAAREIVGPDLGDGDPEFKVCIEDIFTWASDG